jgi:hypothetical protein
MLRWLRRQKQSRRHPSPEQALEALRESRCLYSPVSSCSGAPASVGLRNVDDESAILVCGAHYGRLRRMPPRDLDRLEYVLREAFGCPIAYAHEDDAAEDTLAFLSAES